MRRKLRPYQVDALKYASIQHPALFIEMRLGKTLITIRRIKRYPDCNKVLVVAPYSALNSWKKDDSIDKTSSKPSKKILDQLLNRLMVLIGGIRVLGYGRISKCTGGLVASFVWT